MSKNNQQLLAERIDELCSTNRMTYYLLSYKSAVPITTLMNIVNCNTKNPGIFTIAKLCDGFGITMQEFFDSEVFDKIESKTE